MSKLSEFLSDRPGCFSTPTEDFPWIPKSTRHAAILWYALFVVEEGRIQKYGFRSTRLELGNLVEALKALSPSDEALLFAVWHTEYAPQNLILIDLPTAIHRLQNG